MPPVRAVSFGDNWLTLVDRTGTKTYTAAMLPGSVDTAQKAEDAINAWLVANITDYQVRVHVFSLSPLRVTVGTWNTGASIPQNWWNVGQ